MAIELNDNIKILAPKPDSSRYWNLANTPYTDTVQVLSEIPIGLRFIGMLVNVNGTEYWFRDGINLELYNKPLTGLDMVAALQALPLADKLTANDITYNAVLLKTFLDNLTGSNLGVLEIETTYNGNFFNGMRVAFYDNTDTLIKIVETLTGSTLTTLPIGVYTAVLLPPTGYITDMVTITDANNSDNASTVTTISGITINSSIKCTINIVLVPEAIPVLNYMLINNGDLFSSISLLSITPNSVGVIDQYMLSESSTFAGALWINYTGVINYNKDYISDITVVLYLKLRNSKGVSNSASDSITMTNGFHRSDVSDTYNLLGDAINAVIADYNGNLTQDVMITCVGMTINTRNTGSYLIDVNALNKNSDYVLIIDGTNRLTLDCASLGGIRIKDSKNILINDINFINVGSQLTEAAPEELAAVFSQGTPLKPCNNIVIKSCHVDCRETYNGITKDGSYGFIAKNTTNFSTFENNIINAAAVLIKCSFVNNLNVIKNIFRGTQVIGIVSQPTLVLNTNGKRVYISDNDFNGDTFDTGLIIDARYVTIIRNKFHSLNGESIRMINTTRGVSLDISSNSFYNNLLVAPYPWVKYTIILNNYFETVRFVSNTCEMRGVNYSGTGESLIRGYNCTINKLIFSNNIIYINCPDPRYANNTSGGNILNFSDIVTLESNNNIYLDISADNNTLNTPIITTDTTSTTVLRFMNKISDLNALGYEIDSRVIPINSDLFVSKLGYDYKLTINGSVLAVKLSGDVNVIDNNYKLTGSTVNSGAFGYNYNAISETDLSTDYIATDLDTDTVYTINDVINVLSTQELLFETLNKNRTAVLSWKIIDSSNQHIVNSLLGLSGFVSVFSNLNPDGTYLSDASYNIEINLI